LKMIMSETRRIRHRCRTFFCKHINGGKRGRRALRVISTVLALALMLPMISMPAASAAPDEDLTDQSAYLVKHGTAVGSYPTTGGPSSITITTPGGGGNRTR
jgi:hypothetical protein